MKNAFIENHYPVFAKTADMKKYSAIDLSEGMLVTNRIYQSFIPLTEENKAKLQRIATANNIKFQIRGNDFKKVLFETV